MSIIPLLLFSLSCNFDNFLIGISYGLKKITVDTKAKIIIALPTLIGTYLSLRAGRAFFSLFPIHYSNIISCCILLIIGVYIIIKTKRHKSSVDIEAAEKAEKYDKDNDGRIDMKEAFILGLFLAINNIGLGIGFSTSNSNILLTCIFTSLLSAVGFNIGYSLSKRYFSKLFSYYAEFVSGFLIIALGIIELFL